MELATSSISGVRLNFLSPKSLTAPTFHSFKNPQSTQFLTFHSLVPRPLFSDGFVCRGSSLGFINNISSNSSYNNKISNKIYKRLDSCLVIPPPGNKKPRAIIKFLGGAFIGAVPEVTYSYLIELLAKEGFLILSVPYNVTFDHEQAANQVYERFNACLDNILAFGFPDANLSPDDLVNLPIFSVGHSNGALLQVLTGSYFCDKIPKANAIISYNNRPATEAVPYFEQLGPLVRQMMPVVEASPVYSMARSASDDAWKMFIDTAGAMIPDRDEEVLVSFNRFVDQLPSVFGQVTQGISEFKPTPSENRECCKNKYNVQNTLLVKFNFDTIDETDLLEETLKPRVESIGGTLEKVQLNGTHLTPCAQVLHCKTSSLAALFHLTIPLSVYMFGCMERGKCPEFWVVMIILVDTLIYISCWFNISSRDFSDGNFRI